MEEYSDTKLLEMFRSEDSKSFAFNLIIKKYQKKIYSIIRRMLISHDDTDDVLQETFIKVWNKLDLFKEESQLYTWLYRIAVNESLNFLKKKRTRFFIPIIDVEYQLSKNLEADSVLRGNQIQMKLQQAVIKLPEKQRLVFNMKYFEEMKYEEMSEVLGTSIGALKASYHLAVKKIEEHLRNH
ncbi:MAG: sigma-70 family RNA polymerase sigma factor [Bacteroidia bacterium]|nr:sigma-70 family RNA polymerase sigma factor [Bacteroidia bacterium]MCZ2249552.1 sigma-70 family RNA polymerase sigma factor [Bacteroidia bacterium]